MVRDGKGPLCFSLFCWRHGGVFELKKIYIYTCAVNKIAWVAAVNVSISKLSKFSTNDRYRNRFFWVFVEINYTKER